MKNAVKKIGLYLIALSMMMVNLQTVSADQVPPSEREYTPSVLVGEITEDDTQIPVYVYDWTTLYVKNGEDIIYRKFYKEEGKKNIKIKKQPGNSRLEFYLISKDSGKKGKTVTKKVTKLPVVAKEKPVKTIAKPQVQKTVTSQSQTVRVSGKKGTTLVVKNQKKTLKLVKFKKDENRKITIPRQDGGVLYFYLKKGNARGAIVSRIVKDATAPKAPKVKVDSGSVRVKGELGAEIYFKGSNGWRHFGTVKSSQWNCFLISIDYSDVKCDYFEVYLKDAAGNKSKTVKVKNPSQDLPHVFF